MIPESMRSDSPPPPDPVPPGWRVSANGKLKPAKENYSLYDARKAVKERDRLQPGESLQAIRGIGKDPDPTLIVKGENGVVYKVNKNGYVTVNGKRLKPTSENKNMLFEGVNGSVFQLDGQGRLTKNGQIVRPNK
jgi:hypothetical protein